MSQVKTNQLVTFLAEPMSADLARMQEKLLAIEDVAHVALMPDAHVADGVCVGTVVASREGLYPDAVGGDIGCGMTAVRLNADLASLSRRFNGRHVLETIARRIPVHKWPRRQSLPEELLSRACPQFLSILERDAAVQLGTLGRGNHFLEIDYSDDGEVWLLLHSGSRCFGPQVRAYFRRQALKTTPALGNAAIPGIIAESPAGESYLRNCEVALAYAELNRHRLLELSLEALSDVLGIDDTIVEQISCIHNFVRRETLGDEKFWFHRKGALSARAGELGIVPGTMGTESYLVEGRGNAVGLYSSSHGAGRVRSRGEAFRCVTQSRFEREMGSVTYSKESLTLLLDEAPSNYKPIASVMRAQRELTKIRKRLRPWVVFKGT